MESNGVANRIHVSEATARLLQEGGKGSWLTEREEMIEAKGKGKMKTLWATVTAGTATSATSFPSLDGSDFVSGELSLPPRNESAQDVNGMDMSTFSL